jgi:RHS repeat-associated protein
LAPAWGRGVVGGGGGGASGGGGDCGDECDPGGCPGDNTRRSSAGDPVLMPTCEFVMEETDFSMEERGVRFSIKRAHRNQAFVDPYVVQDFHAPDLVPWSGHCLGTVQRGRNLLFGEAWNSTLQMYAYWRPKGCEQRDYFRMVEIVNLGGYHVYDLFLRPDPNNFGRFVGPSDPNRTGGNGAVMDWFRFEATPPRVASDYAMPNPSIHLARTKKNPGVLITRDGTKYYFDFNFDPNEPNAGNDANPDNIIQLLRRKENRYGQGYDYHYAMLGQVGSGNVQYLLTDVTTPAGRHILFNYNDISPNHVTSVDLADENWNVIEPNLVEYGYYPPDYADANNAGQLMYARKAGCNCGGGNSAQARYYEYERRSLAITSCDPNFNAYAWSMISVKDAPGNTVVANSIEPNLVLGLAGSYVCSWVRGQQTPDPNNPAALVDWSYEPNLGFLSSVFVPGCDDPNIWPDGVVIKTTVTDPAGGRTIYSSVMEPTTANVGTAGGPYLYDFGSHAYATNRIVGEPNDANRPCLHSGSYTYDPNWQGLMGYNRPDGSREEYVYDRSGRRIQTKVRDPATGQWHETERRDYSDADSFSQVTARYEPGDANVYWSYTHDANGNMTESVGPTVMRGLAPGLESYQPVDTYTYAADPNDANDAGNWGLMTTHTDPEAMVTKYEYNKYGYLTRKIVDFGGQNLTHTYVPDDFGRSLMYTDPGGAVTQYLYNPAGKVTDISLPQGEQKHYDYDPDTGWLTQEIDWLDPCNPNTVRITTYERHPVLGNVFSKTETGVGTTRYGYDPMGRVKWIISPRGLTTEYAYDGFGRLSQIAQKESGQSQAITVQSYAYDAMDRVTQMVRYDDPNHPTVGRTTSYTYDVLGRQITRTEPDETTFHTDYDAAGRVKRQYVTDPNGVCISDTTFDHDELGRVWQQRDKVDPNGADDDDHDRILSTYRYRDGKVARVAREGAGATTYHYDTPGRLVRTDLPDDTSITLTLNDRGDVLQQDANYPGGRVMRVTYQRNTIGQVTHMTNVGDPNNPANETTSYWYYPTGQLMLKREPSSVDPTGAVSTGYAYTPTGQLAQVVEAYGSDLARTTIYDYDPNNGNLARYIGVNTGNQEQITNYAHDIRGNVTSITYPNNDSITMTYDLAGRILTRAVNGGASIDYEYNSRGMLSKRTGHVPNGGNHDVYEDTFGYDALGRMTSAIRKLNGDQTSKVEFAYDTLGRLLSETQTIGTVAKTVEYADYDQGDRRLQMKLPEQDITFNYGYDAGGRVQTVGRVKPDANDVIAAYAYNGPAVAKRRVTLSHGQDPNLYLDWDIERDGLLRLTRSTSTHVGDDPNLGIIFASFAYERAKMGDPNYELFTWTGDPNGTKRQYAYDDLHRLTQVIYGTNPDTSPKEAFQMDLAGNRITYHARDGSDANYVSNTANQYTHITPPGADLSYDAAGNLTADHRGYTYAYDHDNKLRSVSKAGSPAVELASFEYDALGRRILKIDEEKEPNVTTRYVYDAQNVVAEYKVAGGTTTRLRYYVNGPTYIDERVLLHDDQTNRDYVYLLKDLYTVAGLTDQWGWAVEYYDYDAYGTVHMSRCAMLPFAADLDGDGDVDNDDLAIFKQCYKGSGNEPNTYAGSLGWLADLDSDGDVDGSDYVLFSHCYNGPGNPPRCPTPDAPHPIVSPRSMPTSRVGNPYFFTGRPLDVFDIHNSGSPYHFTDDRAGLTLYDYRARIDLPDWGRFAQMDRSGYHDGFNAYQYGRGNPARFLDPSGNQVGVGIGIGLGIGIAEEVAAAFGLTLTACMLTPSCAQAVQRAIADALKSAGDVVGDIGQGAGRCLCKNRHPTWMSCTGPKDSWTAAQQFASQDAAGAGGRAFVQSCRDAGPATNCPGGAPGTRYYCIVVYWVGWPSGADHHPTVHERSVSVNCCSCCNFFTSGTSCKGLHLSGGGQPPGQ